jgi:hypothetical protein
LLEKKVKVHRDNFRPGFHTVIKQIDAETV